MRPAPAPAVALIRHYEALRLAPYHDAVGFATIGWGHLLSRTKWASLDQWQPITADEAERLFQADIAREAIRPVSRLITVPLTDGQYGALLSFTFNLGGGALEASTLRRCVNRGDHEEAARQFGRWVTAGGRVLRGLVRRRAAEAQMYRADAVQRAA